MGELVGVKDLHLLVQRSLGVAGESLSQQLGVSMVCYDGALKPVLKQLSAMGAALVLEEDGLGLYALDMPGAGAVRVSLQEGKLGWRLVEERARHEMIVKACGVLKAEEPLSIFDATAGLLRDACVLAAAGASVRVAERSPIIAALIEDGLQRASAQPEMATLLSRLTFIQGDSLTALQALAGAENRPDVVCLDPMFPHREKSALVKKEMRVFRTVVGEDEDADQLLAPALAAARKRVVVKRPKAAPPLANHKPSFVLEGKSGRFDIYLKN